MRLLPLVKKSHVLVVCERRYNVPFLPFNLISSRIVKETMLTSELRKRYPGLREQDMRYICRLWETFEPYADHQFKKDILANLQGRFWEMYLGCTLIDCGHPLVPSVDRLSEGPDLCVSESGKRVWIEATAPQAGQGVDAVPDRPADGQMREVPDRELILRYRSAFLEKQRQFRGYRKKGLIDDADVCVIAISGGGFVGLVRVEAFHPRIVHALYPLGERRVSFIPTTGELVDEGHTYRESISKSSGSDVHTDVLLEPADADISAVIFSYADPCNHPVTLGEDFVVCHHIDPAQPLGRGWLPRGKEYWVDGDLLSWRECR